MKAMNLQDSMFLLIEQRQQPMHVGGLSIYTPPKDAGPDYAENLYQAWRKHLTAEKPFNQRPLQKLGVWYWEEDLDFDLDYHLRHLSLPKPGRIRELLVMVSRLHGALMDRSRPLWEVSLIEGLADGRFAIYSKMHHAMVDGVTATKMAIQQHSYSAKDIKPPIWAQEHGRPKSAKKAETSLFSQLGEAVQGGREMLPGIVSGLWEIVRPSSPDAALSQPFQAPPSPFNVPISGSRRFVAQSYELERLKAIGKASGAKLNDVVMALCSGALRRYLQENDVLPETSLIAMLPVSMHGETDKGGNQVATILANLATNEADPIERLQRIIASTQAAKQRMSKMVRLEKVAHTAMMMSPMLPSVITGHAASHPVFNLVISNVPGPTRDLYLNGAHLDESYPVSIPMAYQAINITVTSYVDKMAFGFTACRRAVPNMQRLVDYLDDAFVELEKALGLKQARRAPAVKAAATPATAPKAAKPRAARKPKAASPAAKTPVAAPATAPKPAKPRAPRKARAASPAA
ncbi:acyltransferase, WS/DGAT/MGAT [Pseudomonas pohangensis]|uniref:diacylglycerol O-acyltransferase n=1 Tax=Pseudomonas pohangensis TaxID=364197 RepID=A0A1H2I697_9PSED|nr:wax ester/triacylglycerol synthase family O-acyltransferase [Pseudomonas pohangensis]SDU39619.1 acyltransferase, WS/DGAT/MGAT [Pseudomonas pohangensis]